LARLALDPSTQLICAQCSGTLLLSALGLLNDLPACTDLITTPWVINSGVAVLNQPFFAKNNIATAGGCMASQYLATWVITKLAGTEAAEEAIFYVAPVGENETTVAHNMSIVMPYIE
jgi:transcriptional regulator GlxA family with amidase domain